MYLPLKIASIPMVSSAGIEQRLQDTGAHGGDVWFVPPSQFMGKNASDNDGNTGVAPCLYAALWEVGVCFCVIWLSLTVLRPCFCSRISEFSSAGTDAETWPLCTITELNLGNRVLGEVEKNSFIAWPTKGNHSGLMSSKLCILSQWGGSLIVKGRIAGKDQGAHGGLHSFNPKVIWPGIRWSCDGFCDSQGFWTFSLKWKMLQQVVN